jgi:hypothetical protein
MSVRIRIDRVVVDDPGRVSPKELCRQIQAAVADRVAQVDPTRVRAASRAQVKVRRSGRPGDVPGAVAAEVAVAIRG